MKQSKKIVVLVALALALMLSLSACKIAASRPPETATPASGEVPFPVETQDPVSVIATQTALAEVPLPVLPTDTPQVIVATNTPEAGQQPATDQQQQPSPTTEAGGGQVVVQPAGPTPVVERPTTYTLVQGEWPICIARRFDLDIDALFAQNGLNMYSKPAAGTVLKIPASGSWDAKFGSRALKSHPVDYTVVAGDTVNAIACDFGDVTPEAILAVNGISASDIKAGATIRIP